jgi:hypothetical protein
MDFRYLYNDPCKNATVFHKNTTNWRCRNERFPGEGTEPKTNRTPEGVRSLT